MVFLMFEAILVFSPQSSLIEKYSHVTKANIHGYMMAAASLSAAGGFVSIYLNKEQNNKNHFTTWHAWVGVITLVCISLQLLGGLCLKYNSILRKLAIRLVDMKLYHATAGLVTFTFVSISILLGMYSNWFTRVTGGTTWYGCMACLACIAMMVMQQITTKYMPQARRPRVQADAQKSPTTGKGKLGKSKAKKS